MEIEHDKQKSEAGQDRVRKAKIDNSPFFVKPQSPCAAVSSFLLLLRFWIWTLSSTRSNIFIFFLFVQHNTTQWFQLIHRSFGSDRSEMADQLSKGEEFLKKAEKKLSGWGLFGSKYEDAADLFDKAANSFKLAKSCFSLSFSPPFYYYCYLF